MKTIVTMDVVTATAPVSDVKDSGTVQIGALSPAFPPVRATPPSVRDRRNVEMGALSPAFPPVRTA
ncbi:MAG TPA: hypothetical protein VEK55_00925 [Xanthobacteraceae bacterium]|nr:hypothetical protein [Xanthobacteraceae bacterium]